MDSFTSASWRTSESSRPKTLLKSATRSWSNAWVWTRKAACVSHAGLQWPSATSRWAERARAVETITVQRAVTRGNLSHAANTAASVESIAETAVSGVAAIVAASGAAATADRLAVETEAATAAESLHAQRKSTQRRLFSGRAETLFGPSFYRL